jgi:hypothetical protein
MIRRILEFAYGRTIGTLRNVLEGFLTAATRGGGLLQLVYILLLIGLTAGFVNALAFPVPNQGLIVFPNGTAQTIPEAVIDAFVILVGGAGIYLAYVSGRQTTKARTVNLYLGLALLLLVVSMLTGLDLVVLKQYG